MDSNIVFIGGAPRSGTTLVQRLVDSHPDIIGGPELNAIPDIVSLYRQMSQRIVEERTDFYYETEQLKLKFREFIFCLFSDVSRKYHAKWVSEKTPPNVFVFKYLNEIIPEAKYIYVERDPKDIISSYLNVKKRAKEKKQTAPIINRFLYFAIDDVLHYMKAGKEFCRQRPDAAICLNYEKLVDSPQDELERICSFLNIKYDEKMLSMSGPGQFYLQKRVKKVNSIYYTENEISRPIDNRSIGKWKENLTSRDADLVNTIFRNVYNSYRLNEKEKNSYRGTSYLIHRKIVQSAGVANKLYRRIIEVMMIFVMSQL